MSTPFEDGRTESALDVVKSLEADRIPDYEGCTFTLEMHNKEKLRKYSKEQLLYYSDDFKTFLHKLAELLEVEYVRLLGHLSVDDTEFEFTIYVSDRDNEQTYRQVHVILNVIGLIAFGTEDRFLIDIHKHGPFAKEMHLRYSRLDNFGKQLAKDHPDKMTASIGLSNKEGYLQYLQKHTSKMHQHNSTQQKGK